MALELAIALAAAEKDDNLHVARLLLLLAAHAGDISRPMQGLTKLAKLDFLLRYPTNLERALSIEGKDPAEARLDEFERTTIESKMVRFRYGPWDHRYRRWISLMAARNLVSISLVGRTVMVAPTESGRTIALQLAELPTLGKLFNRAKVVAKRFGGRNGTALKNFIYETFPELLNMKWGESIA